jgi:hypothetical protein
MRTTTTSRRGAVRRALRLSTVEGILAEWVSACAGGGALVAWALHLDAPGPLVASLAALPALAQAVQVPAARLTARLGARRTAVVASLASRQPYAALALLPVVPAAPALRQTLLAAIAALAALLGTVAQHAWLAWTTTLFRAPIRGRILARRSGRVALAGGAAALGVGALLDRCIGEARTVALAALAGIAWLSGVASAAVLSRQHAPRSVRLPRARPVRVREALARPPVRRGLRYVCAWNAAMGATAGVTALFMLHQLGLGFLAVAAHGLAIAATAAAAAPFWGRLVDRSGVAPVLVASALAAAVLPVLWLPVDERVLWPIAVDAVLGGLLLGGHGVAVSALPVAVAPRGRRAEVLAAYSTAAGLAFAAASMASGWLAAKLPFLVTVGGNSVVARKLFFAAGAAARLAAAALAARVFRGSPGQRPAPGSSAPLGMRSPRSPRSSPACRVDEPDSSPSRSAGS